MPLKIYATVNRYSLYFYGLRKLHSPEDSKQLVLSIFNVLWQKRHFLPVSFNLAKDLYEEGKKEIVKRLSQKLVGVGNLELVENLITSSDGQLEIYNSISPELTIQQQPKLVRYINGQTTPAGQWQIQD